MNILEHEPIGNKTTMRIGGTARYFTDVRTTEELEEAAAFAAEKGIRLIVLGGGSNTIFGDSEIDAVVIRIKADAVHIEKESVTVEAGKILAVLVNELAEKDLDLSALTGIPGTLGGAVFGNAGQGPGGVWIDSFVESVNVFENGEWKTMTKEECNFRYRESGFKDKTCRNVHVDPSSDSGQSAQSDIPIIWSATLHVPKGLKAEIESEIQRLLEKRIETQPHIKTAGSCFKALVDGTPAWKLIDAAGLRGLQIGGIQVSEKHANFLLNVGGGTCTDVESIVEKIKHDVPEIAGVEMRIYK